MSSALKAARKRAVGEKERGGDVERQHHSKQPREPNGSGSASTDTTPAHMIPYSHVIVAAEVLIAIALFWNR
jgi:hypothetical protein